MLTMMAGSQTVHMIYRPLDVSLLEVWLVVNNNVIVCLVPFLVVSHDELFTLLFNFKQLAMHRESAKTVRNGAELVCVRNVLVCCWCAILR